MKILLDECVPTRFAELLPGYDVAHVTAIGWAGIQNGELLAMAGREYDAIVTVDYELPSQLTAAIVPMPVIVLHGASNKLKHIKHLAPVILDLVGNALEKQVYRLGQ